MAHFNYSGAAHNLPLEFSEALHAGLASDAIDIAQSKMGLNLREAIEALGTYDRDNQDYAHYIYVQGQRRYQIRDLIHYRTQKPKQAIQNMLEDIKRQLSSSCVRIESFGRVYLIRSAEGLDYWARKVLKLRSLSS